ncbi:MAG: hypothetical protein M3Y59_12580 [Myxococcota bacterium]|nr:hypothetical protein [Myxococcota bacterium]
MATLALSLLMHPPAPKRRSQGLRGGLDLVRELIAVATARLQLRARPTEGGDCQPVSAAVLLERADRLPDGWPRRQHRRSAI